MSRRESCSRYPTVLERKREYGLSKPAQARCLPAMKDKPTKKRSREGQS
jgi:hypothetical protein